MQTLHSPKPTPAILAALAIVMLVIGFSASTAFAQGPGIKTDYGVYPEPTPPSLPPAGGTFIDPTFGTTIMRVTDVNDGNFNVTAYSYWPTFNKDNTRLFI